MLKRRIMTVLILVFASFLLVGCDLFGGNDTTTTLTTTSTTTSQSSESTTEALEDYYTVTFYDGDGSVFETQQVLEGDAASMPAANPTKAADAQYTYTFDHWDQDYSNVTADMDIYPIFSTTVNMYTVTFYDAEGEVLSTQSVPYGGDATAPEDPEKASVGDYVYEFNGWNAVFTGITGNVEVYPTFSTLFNHELLVQMVTAFFGGDEVETRISDLTTISGLDEEGLYNLLNETMSMVEELPTIETAAEFQTWYQGTKDAGLDKDLLIDLMYYSMSEGMSNDLDWIQEEISNYSNNLIEANDNLTEAEGYLDYLDQEAEDYCLYEVASELSTDCQSYWDNLLNIHSLRLEYYDLEEIASQSELFDYWDYDDLIYYQSDILYYTYIDIDESMRLAAETNYNNVLSGLTQAEIDLYTPVIEKYIELYEWEAELRGSDWDHLEVADNNGEYIRQHLQSLYYGTWDTNDSSPYYEGYQAYAENINMYNWMIENIEEELSNLEAEYEEMNLMVGYMFDSANEASVKLLFGTVYDGLDQMIVSVDEEMFEMVQDMMMSIFISERTYLQAPGIDEEIDIFDYLTTDNLVLMADELELMISAFYDTMDQSDYDNIKSLLLGYLDVQFEAEGMT
ncbi:MAG: hypothetical protein PQJ44_06655, partial [Sphaerochaetaceae bacterium]|nr:hypothetical protein [Sphaerochaetaceae bacterium]